MIIITFKSMCKRAFIVLLNMQWLSNQLKCKNAYEHHIMKYTKTIQTRINQEKERKENKNEKRKWNENNTTKEGGEKDYITFGELSERNATTWNCARGNTSGARMIQVWVARWCWASIIGELLWRLTIGAVGREGGGGRALSLLTSG